jgi:hypothetical protein
MFSFHIFRAYHTTAGSAIAARPPSAADPVIDTTGDVEKSGPASPEVIAGPNVDRSAEGKWRASLLTPPHKLARMPIVKYRPNRS